MRIDTLSCLTTISSGHRHSNRYSLFFVCANCKSENYRTIVPVRDGIVLFTLDRVCNLIKSWQSSPFLEATGEERHLISCASCSHPLTYLWVLRRDGSISFILTNSNKEAYESQTNSQRQESARSSTASVKKLVSDLQGVHSAEPRITLKTYGEISLNIFQKAKTVLLAAGKFFGVGLPNPPKNKLAEIPPADYYPQRAQARRRWQKWRGIMQRIGPPRLSGERLARVAWQCDARHLTVLCKGRKLTEAARNGA